MQVLNAKYLCQRRSTTTSRAVPNSDHLQLHLQLSILASCLIYARALLEYVTTIIWLRSVIKMLPSTKFVEDKVLTFLILREKC